MKLVKAGLIGISLLFSSSVFADAAFNVDQQKAIEKIVHDYLVSHPQVLMEAATALQKQQQTQWQTTANTIVPQNAQQFFASAESPVMGNPKANVTMVEFYDYQCPHCKDMAPQIQDILKNDANLKIIFKPLPIFGDTSVLAAKAAMAAQKQGKFLNFHEAIMNVSTPLTQDLVLKIAEQVGLDKIQLQKDMQSPALDHEIKQNDQLAKQLKLTGTPAFVFANVSMDGNKVSTVRNPLLIPGAVSENILIEAIGDVRGNAERPKKNNRLIFKT